MGSGRGIIVVVVVVVVVVVDSNILEADAKGYAVAEVVDIDTQGYDAIELWGNAVEL
jgi:hypothetical protein